MELSTIIPAAMIWLIFFIVFNFIVKHFFLIQLVIKQMLCQTFILKNKLYKKM